jgi:hypothetical protein
MSALGNALTYKHTETFCSCPTVFTAGVHFMSSAFENTLRRLGCKFSNVSANIAFSIFKIDVFSLSENCCWFRQHSRSWFLVPLRSRTMFLFFSRFHVFWNVASSSTRGGLWLLLVASLLLGVTRTPLNSITSGRFQKPLHGSGIGRWEEAGAGNGRTRERAAIQQGIIRALRKRRDTNDRNILLRPGGREKRRWRMSLGL